jgi:hypothetical protein
VPGRGGDEPVMTEDAPVLDAELAAAVGEVVESRGRVVRVTAVQSVAYLVHLEDGVRCAVAPTKPGSLATLRQAAAACGSRACRGCGKTDGDEFHQSDIDGAWFCATCVLGVQTHGRHDLASRLIDQIATRLEREAEERREEGLAYSSIQDLADEIRSTAWEVG